MINIGVIGYGYWGPNLVRNFSETEGLKVSMVSDLRPENLRKVAKRYPAIETTSDALALINDPKIDAVAIATPVFTHYDLAMAALRAGKHVWVEKPLTSNPDQAHELILEAEKRKLVLFVDHTFLYTGAVQKIKELVDGNQLGKILYYDSVRINLGLFQHDVNVLWDLAVHDLSIMDHVIKQRPTAVSATGISHVPAGPENIAYLTCFFDGSLIAHIHVNWLSPVKVRKTLISGDKKMIVYDDVEVVEKIKVYDKGITLKDNIEDVHKMLVSYRTGDVLSPKLDMAEALGVEASSFRDCVLAGKKPVSDGISGLRIVNILEAANRSIALQGQAVKLDWKRYDL